MLNQRWFFVFLDSVDDRDEPLILHCFADYGAESEALSLYGNVIRVGVDATDTNESEPITADAHILGEGKSWEMPFREDLVFDLGVFHPVCSKWASTTSISGDPDDHTNMIPSARSIAERYCEHYIIENVSRAPLKDPIVLDGRMFGLPIMYERAFETNFKVPQPPRYQRFWSKDGESDTAETSSFFFTERSRKWWGSVKGVRPSDYPKQHLAKNTIPAPYIHHVCRAWLTTFEEDNGIDYSNYDEEMEAQRRRKANRSLSEYGSSSNNLDNEVLHSFEEG
jgi:hypothetical protein